MIEESCVCFESISTQQKCRKCNVQDFRSWESRDSALLAKNIKDQPLEVKTYKDVLSPQCLKS